MRMPPAPNDLPTETSAAAAATGSTYLWSYPYGSLVLLHPASGVWCGKGRNGKARQCDGDDTCMKEKRMCQEKLAGADYIVQLVCARVIAAAYDCRKRPSRLSRVRSRTGFPGGGARPSSRP